MNPNDDILDRLQADCHSVLCAVPRLSLVNIIADDQGDLAARVTKALSTLTDNAGKLGLAIIVNAPTVEDAEKNLPGPPLNIVQEILILENTILNRDPGKGTGIKSSQAALIVLGALQLQTIGGYTLSAAKPPIEPERNLKAGYLGHVVRVRVTADGMPPVAKPLVPMPTEAAGALTLTSSPGAAIYYTTDGSYPAPHNPTAVLYNEPLDDLPDGVQIRTAAYLPDLNPSDCMHFTLTP